jgi:hypothetical protein
MAVGFVREHYHRDDEDFGEFEGDGAVEFSNIPYILTIIIHCVVAGWLNRVGERRRSENHKCAGKV